MGLARAGTGRRLRALPGIVEALPWWASALVGVGAVVLGFLLLTRPLSSLGVLTVYICLSCLASGVRDLVRGDAALLGAAWALLGVAVLVRLGTSIELLPRVLGVALLVSGVARLLEVRRPDTADARVASALFGVADLVFGVLALAWPDVTLLVVAVLFGARTVLFGLAQVGDALRRRRGSDDRPSPTRGPLRRWARTGGAVAVALLAVGALVVSGRIDAASPVVDDFYSAPSDVPTTPGVLLRSEPFTREVPADARAWRILYTTTRDEGEPAVASGIVLVPRTGAEHPVIAWAHGTTGYAEGCAPSLLPEPFASGGLPALDQAVARGWALVATDYVGLGTAGPHPYLIGQGEARSVLDAVRAARQLETASLADRTVVWGHSQGGHAALWTGQVQPTYAPDVPLSGVAAMAPAADTLAITEHLPDVTGGSVFASFVIEAYAATYPDVDVDALVIPHARTLVREMATRCLSEPGVLVSVLSALSISRDRPIFAVDPTTGVFGQRLAQNTPTGPVEAPLLVAQGLADPLIPPDAQQAYVARLEASGQALDYRTYAGRDHMGLVADDSPFIPELLAWTAERFASTGG
ncbi:lipase family protein [Cellulomonas sp. ICMP 17802]|uniref:lipase family protein n=1 Tax=Cellulomonas sp. ICMP 17802 TaxID=3239199 RepID=UPI00351B6E45